jgi:hypothetical protein
VAVFTIGHCAVKMLPSFGSEPLVFPSPLWYHKDQDRTLIFAAVLYGGEYRPLTLREERRLRVLEERVLRRVFGPKGGTR